MNYPSWLPFVGFRTLPLDNDGYVSELERTHWESKCFMVEWFGFGFVFFSTDPRRTKHYD